MRKAPCEYMTPRNAAMACMNAIAEIRCTEADEQRLLTNVEQTAIILTHIRDFFGGRIFLMQVRKVLDFKGLIGLLCDDEECIDELRAELERRDQAA